MGKQNKMGIYIHAKPFKGYTLDELRHEMALATLKKEFCKEQLMGRIKATMERSPLSNTRQSAGILGKMLKGLNYVDYALMGYSVFKSLRGIAGFFKRKKK